MASLDLDSNGLIVACSQCGQKNRLRYERLGDSVRCANCKAALPGSAVPLEVHLGERFGVRSIPTMAVFVGGALKARTSGARPAEQIERFIEQSIQPTCS